MTDEQRSKKARLKDGRMIGPIERQRCHEHGEIESYRWTWKPGEMDSAIAVIVRGCSACGDLDE